MLYLDPLSAMLFTLLFAIAVLATTRRAAYGVALLICIQPFELQRYLLGTAVTLPKVALLGVVVGFAMLPGWRDALRQRSVRWILTTLVLLVCCILATLAGAQHRAPVVREALKWIEYAALFLAVCAGYRRDPDDTLYARCWVGVTLLVAVLALAQEFAGTPSAFVASGHVVPRVAGPLEGPNQLGAYLGLSLGVLCATYRRERLAAVTIVVALCALALTFSRGGYVAAAITVTVIAWVRRNDLRALLAPVGIGTIGGALLAVLLMAAARFTQLLPLAPLGTHESGLGTRPELWRAAITLWERRPWLGVGAGNFELDLPQAGLYGVRTHANSWYLQALAEGGIVLLLATLALVVTILHRLGDKLSEAAPWQLAAFAASLGIVAHQAVDYLVFYPKVGGAWWILIGLGASAIRRSSLQRSSLRSASAAPSGAA